ncbi:MAG: DUF4097 family beta strand repeat-containing protein [Gemmatimonadales bacterium]
MTITAGLLLMAGLQADTTITVTRGMRLELSQHQGTITVHTWDRSEVRVSTGTTGGQGRSPEVAVHGETVRIGSGSRGWNGYDETNFTLTVPAWLDLDLSTHEGGINIDGSRARLNLNSVEGDINVNGGRDFLSIQTVEGMVTIRNAQGRIEINAVEGDLRLIDISGSVNAQTVDGSVIVGPADLTELQVNTVDGDIRYRGPIESGGRYRLNTHDGDLVVEVQGDLNAVVSVSTFDGNFESGFPITLTGTSKRQFRFTSGSGDARLDLESFDGNIFLRHAP